MSQDRQAELRRQSRVAHQGRQIRVHRSLDTIGMRKAALLTVLLLPVAMTVAFTAGYEQVLSTWEWVLRFGVERLGVAGSVERDSVTMLWFSLPVLSVRMSSWYPDATVLWSTLVLIIAVVTGTLYLPDWALPIAYFLRLVCLLQFVALLVFFAWPGSFPYDAQQHLRDCFALGVTIIGLVPWLHAMTYYIFDFGILRKIALTAATMLFLACYLPVKILVHVYVLDRFSLVFMPMLFVMFGLALDVFVLIALYAYAMSWRRMPE